MYYLIAMLALTSTKIEANTNWRFQSKQIDKLIRERGSRRISEQKRQMLVTNFMFYGRIWRVNPVLAACVGWKESSFREYISRGGAGEIGIMQVIPWEGTIRKGYRLCTGKRGMNYRVLRKAANNICVGIYELQQKRAFIRKYINWYRKRNRLRYCKWHNPRYWSWRHRRLFKKHPHLQKYFWVASYNWGGKIYTRRGRWDTPGYPIRVLKCFQKYGGFPRLVKEEVMTTTVRFRSGNAKFSQAERETLLGSLRQLAEALRKNKSLKMRITGYTDWVGGWSYNKRLSKKRAKRIYDMMIFSGAPKNRVSYHGKGEANPIASNRTKDGRALNRRVEITIYKEYITREGEKENVRLDAPRNKRPSVVASANQVKLDTKLRPRDRRVSRKDRPSPKAYGLPRQDVHPKRRAKNQVRGN